MGPDSLRRHRGPGAATGRPCLRWLQRVSWSGRRGRGAFHHNRQEPGFDPWGDPTDQSAANANRNRTVPVACDGSARTARRLGRPWSAQSVRTIQLSFGSDMDDVARRRLRGSCSGLDARRVRPATRQPRRGDRAGGAGHGDFAAYGLAGRSWARACASAGPSWAPAPHTRASDLCRRRPS